MRLRSLSVSTAALALALGGPTVPAFAHGGGDVDKVVMKRVLVAEEQGVGVKMATIANLPYKLTGATSMAGSDIEFGRIGGRDYAFAGTLRNGMQIVDITTPTAPRLVSVYDCRITQGDIQVFRQGARVLATYTADSTFGTAGAASTCAKELGLQAGAAGTVIVDVTDPAKPKGLGFAPVPKGSHNMTVHPSGNFLYNSNSNLLIDTANPTTSTSPAITIFNISDPTKPVKVQDYLIPYIPLSLGSESHDITFNEDGSRAYSAALSQTLVLDTTDPAAPKQIAQILDPTVQVVHGADPITLTRSDGSKRTLLVVSDEQAGAAAGTNCPGGGLHFYDITGDLEANPAKVATWFIEQTTPSTATCTAHVFRMHGDQGLLTVAWYDQGVRVLDVAGLADVTGSPATLLRGTQGGIKEIGSYVFTDSNTWSFKTNAIASDGSFFGFGNDLGRGFDVYRFEGLGRTVPALVPTELRANAAQGPAPAPAAPAAPPRAAASGPALPATGGLPVGIVLLATAFTAGAVTIRRRRAA